MKKNKAQMESNIWKFYLYRFFCSFLLSSPIYVLFLQDNGMTMFQVSMLQTIYTITFMILNIPAGVLTDLVGRKKVLFANTFFYLAGWGFYSISDSFGGFAVAEILIAFASALYSASATAFLYDTLLSIDKESNYKKVYGNALAIDYAVWSIGSLLGAYVATRYSSFRLPLQLTLIPIFFALIVSFMFREPTAHKKEKTNSLEQIKTAAKFSMHHPKIKMLIIYSAMLYGVGSSVYMFYQPYFKSISIPIVYFGAIYAAMSIFYAVTARYAHRIESKLGERWSLLLIPLLHGSAIMLMAFQFKQIGVIFPMIIFMVNGFREPIVSDYMHKHIETRHRGTIMSLSNLVGNLAASLIMPLLGYIIDGWSMSFAFLVASVLVLINVLFLVWIYGNHKRGLE